MVLTMRAKPSWPTRSKPVLPLKRKEGLQTSGIKSTSPRFQISAMKRLTRERVKSMAACFSSNSAKATAVVVGRPGLERVGEREGEVGESVYNDALLLLLGGDALVVLLS